MTDSPERPAEEDLPPGVVRVFKKPGSDLALVTLTPEEWERRTGIRNHVSFGTSLPVTQPAPDAGGL